MHSLFFIEFFSSSLFTYSTVHRRSDRVVYIVMAAPGARVLKPVGSATWISTEKENAMNLVDQEMEEVEYPVRNEMEWLNEHMAEIFSSSHLSVAPIIPTTREKLFSC